MTARRETVSKKGTTDFVVKKERQSLYYTVQDLKVPPKSPLSEIQHFVQDYFVGNHGNGRMDSK
jgi:hypothetical protein